MRARCEEKRTHAQCTQLVERESGESNAQLLERGKEESCACVVRVPTTTPTPRDIDPSKRCSASKNIFIFARAIALRDLREPVLRVLCTRAHTYYKHQVNIH